MSGNYPDGVTGREYAIAGADREYTEERASYCGNEDCADYDVQKDFMVDMESYGSDEWGTFICPTCNTEGSYEGTIEYDDSPYDTIQEAREAHGDW